MTNIDQAITDYCNTAAEAGAVYADVKANLDAWEDRFCERMGIAVRHVPGGPNEWEAYRKAEENYVAFGRTKGDAIANLLEIPF